MSGTLITPDFNTTGDLVPRRVTNISFLGGPHNFISVDSTFGPSDLNQIWVIDANSLNIYLPDNISANGKLVIVIPTGFTCTVHSKPAGSVANQFIANCDLVKTLSVTLETGSYQLQLMYLNSGDTTELTWVIAADNALADIVTSDQMINGGALPVGVNSVSDSYHGKVFTAQNSSTISFTSTVTIEPFYFWLDVPFSVFIKISAANVGVGVLGESGYSLAINGLYDGFIRGGFYKFWYNSTTKNYYMVSRSGSHLNNAITNNYVITSANPAGTTFYPSASLFNGGSIFFDTKAPTTGVLTISLPPRTSGPSLQADVPEGSILNLTLIGPSNIIAPYCVLDASAAVGNLIINPDTGTEVVTYSINTLGTYRFIWTNVAGGGTSVVPANFRWVPIISPVNPAEVTSLAQLSDVNITAPSSSSLLGYDGISQWSDRLVDLNLLSDVNISGPSTGELLYFNGVQFTNVSLPFVAGTYLPLDSLSNVDTTGKADGSIIAWNSTSGNWEDAPCGATDLNGLTDVTITTPAADHVLTYRTGTTDWRNGPLAMYQIANTAATTNPVTNYVTMMWFGGQWIYTPFQLSNLEDTLISSLAVNDVLMCVNATPGSEQWVNRTPSYLGGLTNIGDLNDVSITGVADTQALLYNTGTGDWENRRIDLADLSGSLDTTGINRSLFSPNVAFGSLSTNNVFIMTDDSWDMTVNNVAQNRFNCVIGPNPTRTTGAAAKYMLNNVLIGADCCDSVNFSGALPGSGVNCIIGSGNMNALTASTGDHLMNSVVSIGVNNFILPTSGATDEYIRSINMIGSTNRITPAATTAIRSVNVIGRNNYVTDALESNVLGRDLNLNSSCSDVSMIGRSNTLTSSTDCLIVGRSVSATGISNEARFWWAGSTLPVITSANKGKMLIDLNTGSIGHDGSTITIKENVVDMPDSIIDQALALTVKKYNYINEPSVDHIGLIAEDVDVICPILCNYRPTFAEGAWEAYEIAMDEYKEECEADPEYDGPAPTAPVPNGRVPSSIEDEKVPYINLKCIQDINRRIDIRDGTSNLIVKNQMSFPNVLGGNRNLTSLKINSNNELVYQTSSGTIKTDVLDLTAQEADDVIDNIVPKTYKYVDDAVEEPRAHGFIGEELDTLGDTYPLIKTIVNKSDGDDVRGVDYARLVVCLVKKVQEMQTTINDLSSRLITAESDIVNNETVINNHASQIVSLDTRITALE